MRFIRLSASIKTDFAFSFVWRYNVCVSPVSPSVKTAWGHNACVSQACRHLLRRLLRFPSFRVTMYAFHTYVCIYLDGFCVFLLGMVSQCMRFTRLFASISTAFAFSLVWCHNACVSNAQRCVSNACLHRLLRFLRFLRMALQSFRFTRASTSVKTAFAFSFV